MNSNRKAAAVAGRIMSNELAPKPDPSQPQVYKIRIQGHLDSRWANWFDGMTITLEENGDTLLTGKVIDQAALHGLLKKIRDLGMSLVAVNCIEPSSTNNPETKIEVKNEHE